MAPNIPKIVSDHSLRPNIRVFQLLIVPQMSFFIVRRELLKDLNNAQKTGESGGWKEADSVEVH